MQARAKGPFSDKGNGSYKGTRWMPWSQKTMKDVTTCDKPRLAGRKL